MSEMSVTWKQPAVINGDLTGYQLTLTGTIVFIHNKKLQHGNQVKIKKTSDTNKYKIDITEQALKHTGTHS